MTPSRTIGMLERPFPLCTLRTTHAMLVPCPQGLLDGGQRAFQGSRCCLASILNDLESHVRPRATEKNWACRTIASSSGSEAVPPALQGRSTWRRWSCSMVLSASSSKACFSDSGPKRKVLLAWLPWVQKLGPRPAPKDCGRPSRACVSASAYCTVVPEPVRP